MTDDTHAIRRSKIKSRKSAPKSFYLDMNWLGKYWNCYEGEGRVYHHTGPVNQVYALREGLAMLAEEGLEACQQRHKKCADRLWKGRTPQLLVSVSYQGSLSCHTSIGFADIKLLANTSSWDLGGPY